MRPPCRRRPARTSITNVPDGNYSYDTLQFAFNKRFGSGLFIQSQLRLPVARRAARRRPPGNFRPAPTTLANADHQPAELATRSRSASSRTPIRQVSNRQKSTNWQGRADRPATCSAYDIGVATEPRASRAATPTRGSIAATLPNAGGVRFYDQDIDNNRSDTVPILDLRIDKAFQMGRYKFTGMFDRVQR